MGGFRGGFRGWEAGERKEGSGEITRLGPCEILQARHGGAEVAATAPKGSAGEKRDFYAPLNRRMLLEKTRQDVGSHATYASTLFDWFLGYVKKRKLV